MLVKRNIIWEEDYLAKEMPEFRKTKAQKKLRQFN